MAARRLAPATCRSLFTRFFTKPRRRSLHRRHRAAGPRALQGTREIAARSLSDLRHVPRRSAASPDAGDQAVIRKLIVGNGRSEREVLVVSNLLVGRDPACHISEPDPLLSRRHAEISRAPTGERSRSDSRNGVLVNGEKTREQVLFPGDVVQMGHLLLRYVEEVSDAEPVERRRDRRASPADDAAPQPTPFDRFRLNRMRRVVGERSPRQCPAAARPRTKRRLRA